MSTRTFTKKSDVYSFGVLLFELIAGRNPLQGLVEYVELAVINTEGNIGWEAAIDGRFIVREFNGMATLAYKCVSCISAKRPSMRVIVQALSQIFKLRPIGNRQKEIWSATTEEVCMEVGQSETKDFTATKFQSEKSINTAEPPGER